LSFREQLLIDYIFKIVSPIMEDFDYDQVNNLFYKKNFIRKLKFLNTQHKLNCNFNSHNLN